MSEFKQIGTMEILLHRTYALDPSNHDNPLAMEVVVNPGEYPLYHDGYSYIWMMTGCLNGNGMRRGDGMFIMANSDDPIKELVVRFPSRIHGPDEWKELLDHEICREGHPLQRLRVKLIKE